MGQSNSRSRSQRSTEERERIAKVRQTAVNIRINELNQIEEHFENPAPVSIAKEQISRAGKPLTKNDYISIIIALDPSKANKIYELKNLTNEDLVIIIRNVVYDPNRILNNYNSFQIKDNSDILTSHLSSNSIPTAIPIAQIASNEMENVSK